MNRETIASLERQARALDATAVYVLVEGNTLLDVGDTARPIRVHSVRKSLISALYGVAYDQGVVDLGATLGEVGIEDTPPLTDLEVPGVGTLKATVDQCRHSDRLRQCRCHRLYRHGAGQQSGFGPPGVDVPPARSPRRV